MGSTIFFNMCCGSCCANFIKHDTKMYSSPCAASYDDAEVLDSVVVVATACRHVGASDAASPRRYRTPSLRRLDDRRCSDRFSFCPSHVHLWPELDQIGGLDALKISASQGFVASTSL